MIKCKKCGQEGQDSDLPCTVCGGKMFFDSPLMVVRATRQVPPRGTIAKRSTFVLFQFLLACVFLPACIGVAIFGAVNIGGEGSLHLGLTIAFGAAAVYWGFLLVFFAIKLKKTPRLRIQYVDGELVLGHSRKKVSRFVPYEVVSIGSKRQLFFVLIFSCLSIVFGAAIFGAAAFVWIGTGKVQIMTKEKKYEMDLVEDFSSVAHQLGMIVDFVKG
ncbi:MAG: hypothetical protein FWD86_00940 [Firmicutes bacterium]|nr:hypothetical protein [Bacillota bacterium]